MVDESYQTAKSYEKKSKSPLEFIKGIDKRILIVSIATLAFFVYMFYTDVIDKNIFIIIVIVIVFLLFILGIKERRSDVIPIDEAMRLAKEYIRRTLQESDETDTQIKMNPKWILYHIDGVPFTYGMLWTAIKNKKETKYVLEIHAVKGYLVKNNEDISGWNAEKPTNTQYVYYPVPEALYFGLKKQKL